MVYFAVEIAHPGLTDIGRCFTQCKHTGTSHYKTSDLGEIDRSIGKLSKAGGQIGVGSTIDISSKGGCRIIIAKCQVVPLTIQQFRQPFINDGSGIGSIDSYEFKPLIQEIELTRGRIRSAGVACVLEFQEHILVSPDGLGRTYSEGECRA